MAGGAAEAGVTVLPPTSFRANNANISIKHDIIVRSSWFHQLEYPALIQLLYSTYLLSTFQSVVQYTSC